MKKSTAKPEKPAGKTHRRRGLRWWFICGFLLVFVGMLVEYRVYAMHPSGSGSSVVSMPLLRYYVVEIQRAGSSSGMLSPASGSGSAAIVTFVQHVLYAALGGAVMLGIGFVARKLMGGSGRPTSRSS